MNILNYLFQFVIQPDGVRRIVLNLIFLDKENQFHKDFSCV